MVSKNLCLQDHFLALTVDPAKFVCLVGARIPQKFRSNRDPIAECKGKLVYSRVS